MKTLNSFIIEKLKLNKESKPGNNIEKLAKQICDGFGFDYECDSDDPEEDKKILEAIKKWLQDYEIQNLYGPYLSDKPDDYLKEILPNAKVKYKLHDHVTDDSVEYMNFNDYTYIEGGSKGILYKTSDIAIGFTTTKL